MAGIPHQQEVRSYANPSYQHVRFPDEPAHVYPLDSITPSPRRPVTSAQLIVSPPIIRRIALRVWFAVESENSGGGLKARKKGGRSSFCEGGRMNSRSSNWRCRSSRSTLVSAVFGGISRSDNDKHIMVWRIPINGNLDFRGTNRQLKLGGGLTPGRSNQANQ